jgi:hypothetical protein
MSGTLAEQTDPATPKGDNTDGTASNGRHTHTANGTSDASTPAPRHTILRIFKKNATTTEYEFPIGSVVLWDQASVPEGFVAVNQAIGYYTRIGTPTLSFEEIASNHSHTFNYQSSRYDASSPMWNGTLVDPSKHTHTISGTTSTASLDGWELDYVAFKFLKKVGEADTWDGVSNFVYTLFASNGAATNGWSKVSTYDGRFLKIGTSAPATGAAANSSHTHTVAPFTVSGANSANPDEGGPGATQSSVPKDHSHDVTLSVASGNASDPASVTFVLVRKILGQMKSRLGLIL